MRIDPEKFLDLVYNSDERRALVRTAIVLAGREECADDTTHLGFLRSPRTVVRLLHEGYAFRMLGLDRRRYLYLTAKGRALVGEHLAYLRKQYAWLDALGPSCVAEAQKVADRIRRVCDTAGAAADLEIKKAWPEAPPHYLSVRITPAGPADKRICPVKMLAISESWRRVIAQDPVFAVAYGAMLFNSLRPKEVMSRTAERGLVRVLASGRTLTQSVKPTALRRLKIAVLPRGKKCWVIQPKGHELYQELVKQAQALTARIKPDTTALRALRAHCYTPRSVPILGHKNGYAIRARINPQDWAAIAAKTVIV